MQRLSTIVAIVVVALMGLIVVGRGASAQDATPVAAPSLAGHPLVGAWILDTDTTLEDDPPSLVQFTSDGIYTQHDFDGLDGVGSWEATGPSTANLTILSYYPDEEGNLGGGSIIRAAIEVAADGQTLTATYTLELIDTTGATGGEYGPGSVIGNRIAVEPMGEPLGTLDDLFAQFEEEGTPEP